ncbi:hypothetical protein DFJ58DRAFT_841120 [Suillus subalutaceus]|uniref:uncharacterized protein n=1 Tax=Suillus subalutaceus TaxID=48586 RepID=UPI001B878C26|nr:uncharacterized protein DFJ58DRAFT_841120 [Suillus subalutaceus]KAG1855321.1 hypothetical protein DFJ58DRAFT_841120 [Suillus subalutaceus]
MTGTNELFRIEEQCSFNCDKPRSTSPPTSIVPSSFPPKDSSPISLHPETIISDPTPQVGGGSTIQVPMKSLGVNDDRHKRPIQYALFQGGARDENCDLPTKRHKILQTTWNCTSGPSSKATQYLDRRMLELSRITRRAIAERM